MDADKIEKIMSYLREYGVVEDDGEFPNGNSNRVCVGKTSRYVFGKYKLPEKLKQVEKNFSVTIRIELSQVRDYVGIYVSEKG